MYALLCTYKKEPDLPETTIYDTIIFLIDLIAGYLILISTRNHFVSNNIYNTIIPRNPVQLAIFFLIAIIFYISGLIYPDANYITYFFYSFTLFTAYFCFFQYSIQVKRKYNLNTIFLIGTFSYAINQFIPFIAKLFNFGNVWLVNIESFGFLVGLFSKILICLGLHFLIIRLVSNLKSDGGLLERLRMNIDRALHELQKPSDNLTQGLENLIRNQDSYRFTNSAYNIINTLEESGEHINVIIAAAQKMIYNPGVFNFATSNINKEFKFLNINVIIQTAINIMKNYLVKNKIEIPTIEVAFTKHPIVYSNFNDLLQVFINLIKNSLEALVNEERGLIFITTKKISIEKKVLIQIDDNGHGIEPENIDSIYIESFSTKDASSAIRGYGLTIVKEFVDFYHGTIEVHSPYEFSKIRSKGTTFRIYLPYDFKENN